VKHLDTRNVALFERSLIGRADVSTLLGRYKESIFDFERIIHFTKNPRKKVNALISLGKIYLIIGDLKNSRSIFQKAIKKAKKEKLSIETARILNGLSNVNIVETKTKEAKRYAEDALRVNKNISKKGKERMRGIAESYNNLGGIFSAEGHLSTALGYYMKSLKVRELIDDKEGMAIILNNIGVTYMDMRRYKKALDFLKESLVLRKRMGFVQGIALCMSNIGIVYWKQRRYEDALRYFQENVEIQRRLGDKKGLSTSLSNIGVVYKTHGKYKDSIRCHDESLKIRKDMGDRFGMTINLNQLGWIYLMRGDYKKALLINKREKEICEGIKNLPRLMNYYNLRGNILVSLKRFREGYKSIEKSLEISRKLLLSIDISSDLYNLADIIIQEYEGGMETLGTLRKARALLEKGKEIAVKYDHQTMLALFLKSFALLDMFEGKCKNAREKIEKAEIILRENNFTEKLPLVLYEKARILGVMKEREEQIKAIREAGKLARKMKMEPLNKKIKNIKIK
jgi:tetratricopeptide (TPR) repeat protein